MGWRTYANDFSTVVVVHFMGHNSTDLHYAFVYESCAVKSKGNNEVDEEVIDVTNDPGFGKVKLFVEQRNEDSNTPRECSNNSNTHHHCLEEHDDNLGWLQWLKSRCFKQLVKWCNEKIGSTEAGNANVLGTRQPSLRLIPLEEYDRLYNKLKSKYTKQLIQSNAWSTESTDPENLSTKT